MIKISERIIAVEVQRDSTYHTISEMNGVTFLTYIVPPKYPEWEHPALPPDKTYKFLCLASEVIGHGKDYLGVNNDFSEMYKLHPIAFMKLDPSKEYALIEVQ